MIIEQHLSSLIPFLESLKREPSAKVFYDYMSDALVWTDEAIFEGLTPEQMGCMRAIFRYRTSLILGVPDTRFETLWLTLKLRCPQWIGLAESRCIKSEQLLQKYNEHLNK